MILDKLKAYGWMAAAIAAGVFAGVQTMRLNTAQFEAAATRVAHSTTLKNIAELTTKAAEAVRKHSDLVAIAREKNANETFNKIAAANTDRDNAVHAADRLQDRINTVVAAARRANADSGLGSNVSPTRDPIGMLADVLGRAVARARFLAHYADKARIAGESCQRDYDALRQGQR